MQPVSRRSFVKAAAGAAAILAISNSSGLLGVKPAKADGPPAETRYTQATLSSPLWAYVKNGVITRLEEFDANTKLNAWDRAYRKRIYATDRLQTPLKRVDFDPAGNRNPQNRGKSGYVPISWDDALTMVANEMTRIKTTYGNTAIYTMSNLGWMSAGRMNPAYTGQMLNRLLNQFGGSTNAVGYYSNYGQSIGQKYTIGGGSGSTGWGDILANGKTWIFWGADPARTTMNSFGFYHNSWLLKAKAAGVKFIFVDPTYVNSAAELDAEWIPILPGTDNAMLAAMAYVMISENLYDSAFVTSCTVGFSQFKDYILGTTDNVPKTPEWAEPICGVPASKTRALARLVTTKKPAYMYTGLGPQRGANGEHFTRMIIAVAALSGNMGIPGGGYGSGAPSLSSGGKTPGSMSVPSNPVSTYIPSYKWADCVLNPGASIRHDCLNVTYPAIKMVYQVAGINFLNQHSDTNKAVKALRALDFYVVQDMWNTPSTKYADIVLPACTTFERNDIYGGWNYVVMMQQCISPLYQSQSDYAIFSQLATKLGIGSTFTGGLSEMDWLKQMYASIGLSLTWDQFLTQGYYVYPPAALSTSVGYSAFRKDPVGSKLSTPSGLIEIFSQRIADFYGTNDPGVPAVPKFVPPFEWKGSALAAQYPLAMVTPHATHRMHSQFDNDPWLRERSKVSGYEPIWINPIDAAARGISDRDVVKVFNGRGAILAGASVTERQMPGTVRVYQGSWFKPSDPSVDKSLDVGSCANTLTSDQGTSELGQASTSHTSLVEVAKYGGA